MLWIVERAELLDDHHGLAVVAVVVGGKILATIDTLVLEAKFKNHDEGLHEFELNRQRLVLHRDEVDHLKLGVVVGALGHEVVVLAHRGRHGTQEVGAGGLKLLRDLGRAQFVANWLFGAVVDLVNVACG